MSEKINRILSCIQPTADMHIGNYFGAVKNWAELQDSYDCIYGVVDLHAMTMPFDPDLLRTNTRAMMLYLLACGLDPEKSIMFVQSLVPEHTELAWIFNCVCSMGDLHRMTQFKEKSDLIEEKSGAFISAGLFTYPVLQAADIMIYRSDKVPVGKDQEQHLELSREIARRFNKQFGDYFPEPAPLFTKSAKIMSLADPERKMSKSLGEKHYIGLFEDEVSIRKKVKSAVTDSRSLKELGFTPQPTSQSPVVKAALKQKSESESSEISPGVANMIGILEACGEHDTAESLRKDHDSGTLRYVTLKEAVADALVTLTNEIKTRRDELLKQPDHLDTIIREGSMKAREIAVETIQEVRKLTGLPKR